MFLIELASACSLLALRALNSSIQPRAVRTSRADGAGSSCFSSIAATSFCLISLIVINSSTHLRFFLKTTATSVPQDTSAKILGLRCHQGTATAGADESFPFKNARLGRLVWGASAQDHALRARTNRMLGLILAFAPDTIRSESIVRPRRRIGRACAPECRANSSCGSRMFQIRGAKRQ